MNNKFGKFFDNIIAQQNEFMKLIKSKNFLISQSVKTFSFNGGTTYVDPNGNAINFAPSGTTIQPANSGKTNTTQLGPTKAAAAAQAATNKQHAAPSGVTTQGTAQAAPSGATPQGTAKAVPSDPVTEENAIELRRIFVECGVAVGNKSEQHLSNLFNQWYKNKKRVLIIYKNKKGKHVVKKLPITTFNKNKTKWLRIAQENNKANEDNSYVNHEDIINYKPIAIQLLKFKKPSLTDKQAERRFIKRIKSKGEIPVVDNGEIDFQFNAERFLDNVDDYEDAANEFLRKHAKEIKEKQQADSTAAERKDLTEKLKNFAKESRALANSLNISELANACDVSRSTADMYLQPCKMYNIKGDEVAKWDNGNSEIDKQSEINELIKFLENKDLNGYPNHPSCYYYVFYSLTHNGDFEDISKSDQQKILNLYNPVLEKIKSLMDKYPEFCQKGFNPQTGRCTYKNSF